MAKNVQREVRDGQEWTIETDGDNRTEWTEIEQQLANTDGGAPRVAVRQRISHTYWQGRLIASSRADIGKPYPIGERS